MTLNNWQDELQRRVAMLAQGTAWILSFESPICTVSEPMSILRTVTLVAFTTVRIGLQELKSMASSFERTSVMRGSYVILWIGG